MRAYKARRWAPSIGLRLPINTSISQFLRLAVSTGPSYNTPPHEASMPFTLRPYRLLLALINTVCILILYFPTPVQAETKTILSEATYMMGDGETPSFAESMVLQKAKQISLEQAGTYVESYTKVQNLNLTTEEIQTIAGGVLQVEVLDKKRSLVGDGVQFYVKIKATVTTDKMEELAQRVKGKNVAEEYKKLQEDYARLSKEIESWKQLIAQIPPGQERDTALDQIREREKTFAALQKNEAALFQRLVSGESLVRRAQDERAMVDSLFQKILEQGYLIAIGEPTLHKIGEDPINGYMMKLRVPITLQTSKAIRVAMEETAQSLGGNSEIKRFVRGKHPDDTKGRTTEATVIRMGRDEVVSRYFQERVAELTFVLNVTLENGKEWSCTDTNGNRDRDSFSYLDMNPIAPVINFRTETELGLALYDYIRWFGDDGQVLVAGSVAIHNKAFPYSDRVVAFDDIRSFSITMALPTNVAHQIKGITGEIRGNPRLHSSILAKAEEPIPETTETVATRDDRPWWQRLFGSSGDAPGTAPEQPPQKKLKEIVTLCNIELDGENPLRKE